MEAHHQKNWREFFERDEKNRERRQSLIRELPAEPCVKDLLAALDTLADGNQSTVRYPDGTVELSLPISVIAWQLRRSENTARKYIDLAVLTPYLSVSGSKHRSHTYLVCWMAIVDRQPGDDTNAGGCQTAATENTRGGRKGSIGKPAGVQSHPPEGFNRAAAGVQRGVQSGVQQGFNCSPQKPGIKDRVFYSDVNKKPGLKPGIHGGSAGGVQFAIAPVVPTRPPKIIGRNADGVPIWSNGTCEWWRWWRDQIDQRNLRDAADVEELYALGVASGLFPASTVNRLHVFAQAVTDVRHAARRGAIFRENVAFRRWHATCDAEDEAQLMMQALDADGDEIPSAPRPAPAPADQVNDDPDAEPFRHDLCEGVDESRLNQMAKLQQWAAQR